MKHVLSIALLALTLSACVPDLALTTVVNLWAATHHEKERPND